jgi:ABC-type lipoprotein export system ATPase subunit
MSNPTVPEVTGPGSNGRGLRSLFPSTWFSRAETKPGAANGSHGSGNGSRRNGNGHLIDLRQVVKTFETTAGTFTALKGVDLKVDTGEFVAVIGKSGSGKTTLVNMITGIDRPTSGEVIVAGTPIHTLAEGKMAEWRGRNLGIVFQFFQLLPTLTVIENVMLPMDFGDVYAAGDRPKVALRLLDQVGLAVHAHKLPSAISGGEQQRVAIARALANDPPILVADEPTGNLDSKTADTVFRLFESLVDGGKTILMVTHDNDLAKRVTRTIVLSDGEVIEEYLSEIFPTLTEDQLIEVTHQLEPERYTPGEIIMRSGDPADSFYIITRGGVEVLIRGVQGHEIVVANLGEGQYFGEIELLGGGARIATIRAAHDTGVEVACLGRETFLDMVGDSPTTRELLARVAQQRLAENRSGRERRRGHA